MGREAEPGEELGPPGLGAGGGRAPGLPRPRCAPRPRPARAAGAPPRGLGPAPARGPSLFAARVHVGAVRVPGRAFGPSVLSCL